MKGAWRPCDRLPPYRPGGKKHGRFQIHGIRSHRLIGVQSCRTTGRYQLLVDLLPWPKGKGRLWQNVNSDTVVQKQTFVEEYVRDRLEVEGLEDLEEGWWEEDAPIQGGIRKMDRRIKETRT